MSCNHDPSHACQSIQDLHLLTRRHFFKECGIGIGKIALASLLAQQGMSAFANSPSNIQNPQAANKLLAKAKHVIYLFQVGAPSQLDLFDYKPTLNKYDGHPIPEEFVKNQRYAFIEKNAALMSGRHSFKQFGKSGQWLADVLPHLGEIADEICVVRSLHTEQFNHAPAQIFTMTGSAQLGRPSFGSWVSYGLGTLSKDLPAFVVLTSGKGTSGGPSLWGPGFLPTVHQGVLFRAAKDPVLDVANPPGIDAKMQRDSLDLIHSLNQQHLDTVGDPEISTRINAYELAYKMQTSAPELTDLSKEDPKTLAMYGVKPGETSFAMNCLLARRLVERGVRFVNLYHADWDHHSDVAGGTKLQAGLIDQASSALIKDLKQRGLLDETLVVWGGEFGRTPMVENNAAIGRSLGRDHHPVAYSIWMAGGGIKPGFSYGATDELGFRIAENPVHVHDIQATILYLMGIDHTKLTYHFQGRDFRLTDVSGEVVKAICA